MNYRKSLMNFNFKNKNECTNGRNFKHSSGTKEKCMLISYYYFKFNFITLNLILETTQTAILNILTYTNSTRFILAHMDKILE